MTAWRRCQDLSPAAWLRGAPWEQLVTFGPPGFAAYARLRYIPDPAFPGQRENDLDLPADTPREIELVRRAVDVLTGRTATPGDGYVCVWEGYPDPPDEPGPLLTVGERRYALLAGALAALATWDRATPAFVWPADRRWCLTSDVDPHWAGIGADAETIDALVGAPGLDVVRADPGGPAPAYR